MTVFVLTGFVNSYPKGNYELRITNYEWRLYDKKYDRNDRFWKLRYKYMLQEPTPVNIMCAIRDAEIQYPELVYMQFRHESGNFKSKVFRENNNPSGMKQARRRQTTALGTKNNHAYYAHWIEGVIDYKLWQGEKRISGNYIEWLRGRKYNGNKFYMKKFHRRGK